MKKLFFAAVLALAALLGAPAQAQILTPAEALGALPGFLDQHPEYLAKPDYFAALKLAATRDFKVNAIDFAFAISAYQAAHAAPPAPAAPAVDLAARVKTDQTGLLQSVLFSDNAGYARACLQADASGNVQAAVLGTMLDKQFALRNALWRDADGSLCTMLRADPLGRLPSSAPTLYRLSLDPTTDMPSPGRLNEVASKGGLKLALPNYGN